ncbi:5328_t:CDS:2 [Diversispora eburnea]|uniref:5328_t:CDS:1 n=1 Tax=Diversispora eburnea TaxID=1213867 RepID=A0A9N9A3H2_9GLOM|nr:5328_t:CDS:2 [Diversispora eburnea]
MSRARTSDEIWLARNLDKLDELLHNYPKLPKKPLAESSVYIIGMASPEHEDVINQLIKFFEVPNGGIVGNLPVKVSGQPLHYEPGGSGVEVAPDVSVRPSTTFVPRPADSIVIPRPPSDIHILFPRPGVREPGTGYFFRSMTAKLYRQGMETQRWDFGNVLKYSRDPIANINDPNLCNTPNDPRFQINIPIKEVFWDPQFPIPLNYVPLIPTNLIGNEFNIDLYWIQRIALEAAMQTAMIT